MRPKACLAITLVILLSAGAALAGTIYGQGVSLKEATAISDILSRPEGWAGKSVRVSGLVVDVCARRGCWLEISGDKPYEKLRIKVEDGVVVFPVTARGRQATVQGQVEVLPLCPDEALRFRQQEALEKGVPFDPKSVTGSEAALTIRATGAVIE